jgi:predicted dehydrogenase
MNLTPEQQVIGRRNFLRALAGTPALAALGAAAAARGPSPGGPVRLGFIGVGNHGRKLLQSLHPSYGEIRAICDVNPSQLRLADAVVTKRGHAPARHYVDWADMLQKEDLEAVVVATPLWNHAEIAVGCLDIGKHVLCEKMMAWDIAGCERMREAHRRTGRILEIAYQRYYSPIYQAAYDGIVRTGQLGDVHHARLVWHRNANWRREAQPPTPDYDPSRWGYPTFDHLLNWRLYWKYSQGLFAELGSHQLNAANWFFGSDPESVSASGRIYRFKDREVYDHVYGLFEYPGGRTAVVSSIESNGFEENYEMFMGTKGTLILKLETEAYLFAEDEDSRPTAIEVSRRGAGAVIESSETVSRSAASSQSREGVALGDRDESYRREVQRFCAAIRVGTPVACGPERAFGSARAAIRANESIASGAKVKL